MQNEGLAPGGQFTGSSYFAQELAARSWSFPISSHCSGWHFIWNTAPGFMRFI